MDDVILTVSEMSLCRIIGNMRTMNARSHGVNDAICNTGLSMEMDEIGVFGEYAFCKLNNIFFDASISPRSGSYDFVFHKVRFDIKTTSRHNGRLLATKKRNPDVDAFALAILTGNTVSFPGYLLARDLYKDENLIDLGKGEGYAVAKSGLRRWKTDEESKNNC